MRRFLILVLLLAGFLAYIRYAKPDTSNKCIDQLTFSEHQSTASTHPPAIQAVTRTASSNNVPANSSVSNQDQSTSASQPQLTPAAAPSISTTTSQSAASPAADTALAQLPTSIPSTITTSFGKTYTGCVMSRVTPNGISFTHSMGVAKVQFSDLDPGLAHSFGYDPVAAKKYEADELARISKSDADRAMVEAQAKTSVDTTNPSATAPAPSRQPASSVSYMTDEERARIHATIVSLRQDMGHMGNSVSVDSSGNYPSDRSRGAYADKIKEDQNQINQLVEKLDKSPLPPSHLTDAQREQIQKSINELSEQMYRKGIDQRIEIMDQIGQLQERLAAALAPSRAPAAAPAPIQPLHITQEEREAMHRELVSLRQDLLHPEYNQQDFVPKMKRINQLVKTLTNAITPPLQLTDGQRQSLTNELAELRQDIARGTGSARKAVSFYDPSGGSQQSGVPGDGGSVSQGGSQDKIIEEEDRAEQIQEILARPIQR